MDRRTILIGGGGVVAPWRGRFSDYRFHDGRWLPFNGEVTWEIDGQTVTYWQGRLERWETTA